MNSTLGMGERRGELGEPRVQVDHLGMQHLLAAEGEQLAEKVRAPRRSARARSLSSYGIDSIPVGLCPGNEEEHVNLRLIFSVLFWSLWLGNAASAQELSAVVHSGNHDVLGSAVVHADKAMPAGWAPVNDEVAFVYDPQFYFFMRGYGTDATHDKRALYRSFGYVVVAAAGNPGGNATETPWITNESFAATFVEGLATVDYGYHTTYVPTLRGYQSYIIYTNLERTGSTGSRFVYDDALQFGAGNYLLTGDGPQQAAQLRFDAGPGEAAQGSRAISLYISHDTPGSHWKLMLFANGAAAAFPGVDLSAYDRLVFYAKASRNVNLHGAFGTGDDSGSRGFPTLNLTTQYQRFEIDLRAVNRSDVNTPFWVYMHKSSNPFSWAGTSVYLDGIELVGEPTGEDAAIVVDQTWDSLDGACATDGSRTGSCNLRAAVAAAAQVDGPVSVAVTTYQSLSLGQITVPAGADIGVVGTTADRTSVYGQGQGGGRLFQVQEGAALSLAELWVSNFAANDGGAINNQGELTLDGVTVSDSTASCSGTGAMTAFATCWGGAIVNSGRLVLRGGSQFHRNVSLASASTASYTTATSGGGALVNSGELVLDGPVAFANNTADASATSGPHGNMPSGAWASASGGAIWHTGGSLTVTGAAVGRCSFSGNAAIASASAVSEPGTAASVGGAIAAQPGATLDIPSGACTFSENSAQTGPDVYVAP
jgi:hypothetical protein